MSGTRKPGAKKPCARSREPGGRRPEARSQEVGTRKQEARSQSPGSQESGACIQEAKSQKPGSQEAKSQGVGMPGSQDQRIAQLGNCSQDTILLMLQTGYRSQGSATK